MITRDFIKRTDLSIFGKPKGEIDVICSILIEELSLHDAIDKAYILVVKNKLENNLRLGLFLDGEAIKDVQVYKLSQYCLQNIGDIDIFYLNNLPAYLLNDIKIYPPFYEK